MATTWSDRTPISSTWYARSGYTTWATYTIPWAAALWPWPSGNISTTYTDRTAISTSWTNRTPI